MYSLNPGKHRLTTERTLSNTQGNEPLWVRKILRTETISTRSILKGLQMLESSNTKYKVCTKIFKEINNGL